MTTPQNMPLKPCPFCGSDDIEADGVAFYPEGNKENGLHHAPACNNCGATGGDTVDQWNTRAKPVSDEKRREALDYVGRLKRGANEARKYHVAKGEFNKAEEIQDTLEVYETIREALQQPAVPQGVVEKVSGAIKYARNELNYRQWQMENGHRSEVLGEMTIAMNKLDEALAMLTGGKGGE